jgi:hypothetical protein
MELQTTYKPTEDIFASTRMNNLPILRHFDSGSMKTAKDTFRKGEWSMFNILKLAAFGGLGYLTWVYILPPLFFALGQVIAIGGTIAVVGLLIMMLPVILKAMRRLTRFVHKSVIQHDPFGELEEQEVKMHSQLQEVRTSNGSIKKLYRDLQEEATNSEKSAKTLQAKITSIRSKAKDYQDEMKSIKDKLGANAVNNDKYIDLENRILILLSDSDIITHEYEQQKSFISKYGMKAVTMKKVSNKLTRVETLTSNKIRAFGASIKMLKKDYEFARKSNQATTAAKNAMGVNAAWEIEYATEIIASTIAHDISITAGNLKDIDSITSTYSMDSDELFANLDRIADDINDGESVIQSASDYENRNYVPTQEDRANASGFEDIFNS